MLSTPRTRKRSKEIDWNSQLAKFSEYLQSQGRSPNTTKAYARDTRNFLQWHRETLVIGQRNGEIKEIDLIHYFDLLKSKANPITLNRKMASIKAFCAFLAGERAVSKDPSAVLRPVRVDFPRAPEVLNHTDFIRLCRAVDQESERGKRDWAAIQLMAQAGLRIGEVADIRMGDFEISSRKGVLLVRSGKGGHSRKAFLNSTARKALQDYFESRPEMPGVEHLFLSQKKRPLCRRALHNTVKFYLERAGIQGKSAHDLRHLFATRLYNGSKDILLVRDALGHRSLQTTLRYASKTESEVAEKLEEMELNMFRD
ncbi:MAG: tyrosine-type recombinase/integrase [bacterium]|nr:tyrosine-type recombinase/integrase [bacterium]